MNLHIFMTDTLSNRLDKMSEGSIYSGLYSTIPVINRKVL